MEENRLNTAEPNGGVGTEAETDLVEAGDLSEELGQDLELGRKGSRGSELRAKPLTEKMVLLMQKIAEYAYLTMEEIGLVYANQTYAYSVVNTLRDAGLLGEFHTTLKPRKAYFLRPRGYRLLQEYGRLRLKRRFLSQNFKPFIFPHRMACAKAGLILERHPLISAYVPENLLWECRRPRQNKVCDAEFRYKAPGEDRPVQVGLEVELTLKSERNLLDSLHDLRDADALVQVWWLCGNQTIQRALERLIQRLDWVAPQQHFMGLLDDLLKGERPLELSDCRGKAYSLDPARTTLPGWPAPLPRPEPPRPVVIAPAEAPKRPAPTPPRPVVPSWPGPKRLFFRRGWGFITWFELGLPVFLIGTFFAVWFLNRWLEARDAKGWKSRMFPGPELRDHGWSVRPLALYSKRYRHVLGLAVRNDTGDACTLHSVRVKVPKGPLLSEVFPKRKERVVAPRDRVWTTHKFEAREWPKRLLAICMVTGKSKSCVSAVVPLRLK